MGRSRVVMVELEFGRPWEGVAILNVWRRDGAGVVRMRQRRVREYWFQRLLQVSAARGWRDSGLDG